MKKDRVSLDIIHKLNEAKKIPGRALKEAAGLDIVFTCCYNTLDVWKSRQEAMDFYEECQYNSEGSENERYTNIYFDLKSGAELAIDFEDEADVSEIAWMGHKEGNSFPVALVKQKLDSWESAETVAKKIKGGKILPPKEFLDNLEESVDEDKNMRPLNKEEIAKLKKLGRRDLEIVAGPNTNDYYIYSNTIDAYYPVGPISKYSEEDIEKLIKENPQFYINETGDWLFGDYDL